MWVNQARLPSEYQEVEYIQSSGTQFIDTGYLITPTTEVSIDYQYTNASNQDFAFGVGSDTNTSSGMTFCSYIGTTGGVAYFKAGLSDGTGSSTFTNNGPGVDTNRHKFVLNNGHFLTYNSSGTLQKDVTTSSTFTRTATHSFGLFCWWRTDTSAWANKTSAKLYGCEVKDNGVLQRHFIPCYRKSDSVVGLYDLVNNQFYTNSGTGTFSKGNDVTMVEKQVYPAGWKPNANTLIYYPLTSNLVDQMGNGNTGTMHGTCTFDSSTGIHVTGKSGNYITGMSNGIANRNTFTMNVWEKLDQTGKTQCILGYNNNSPSSQCMYINHEGDGYRGVGFFGSSWNYCTIGDLPIDTNWHNVCLLATGTSYQWYIDGVAYGTPVSSSNNMNNYPELQLGWGGAYGSNRAANGYIKDYIVETVARTDAEILNYYNRSKSNYGL